MTQDTPAQSDTPFVSAVAAHELHDQWLAGFDRLQRTDRMMRVRGDRLVESNADFVDDWTPDDLQGISRHLRSCAERGGAVLAVVQHGAVAAFASVEPERFGPTREYAELTYMHVTAPLRGTGLGRAVFRAACSAARNLGATKLYIGVHPAVDSWAFYARMGCRLSPYIHKPIFDREPLDLNLECEV